MSKSTLGIVMAAALTMGPATVLAGGLGADCMGDFDCDLGLECSEAYLTEACPDIACPPGEYCEAPACEPVAYSFCIPARCDVDAHCGPDLVCKGFEMTECGELEPTRACPPEGPCDEDPMPMPEPEPCETVTESYCVPVYIGPCELDGDCGPGFDCVDQEICGCTGGGGTDEVCVCGPDDGDCVCDPAPSPEEEPTEPDCFCEPSGGAWCQPQEIPCDTDNDCLADWSCDSPYGTTTCISSSTTSRDTDEDGGAEPGIDAAPLPPEEDPCVTEEVQTFCLPPGWESWAMGATNAGGDMVESAILDGVARNLSDAESEEIGYCGVDNGLGGCQAAPPSVLAGLLSLFAVARRRRRS